MSLHHLKKEKKRNIRQVENKNTKKLYKIQKKIDNHSRKILRSKLSHNKLYSRNTNRFAMLSRIVENISMYNMNNKSILREVIVRIELERIDTQKEIIVEALLYNKTTQLVISLKFVRKQGFKLKKIEKPIYIRNIDRIFNKEELIKNRMEVNIYYQEHRERTEIDVIRGQKWNMILGIPWLAYYNSEINQKIKEVKTTRYLEECEKQWRPKQKKLEQQKQKKEKKKKKKTKSKKTIEVKKVAKEWKI